ncbi:hypothetical protein PMAYCL1PPCAC_21351 [Pristionchus mayeri]|uniref:Uncharacterized protein n=1 Tax=Pristionchus mayeri TaxID=1317129 RepID=A0AAN5CUH6_9BILA|nr:hypothetical protein PMAYCL1PPCAC_21348 [Pristionchus mayeri]GMR51156.1 hypothetical protein PMAYCL1PPCAC_21351 [Pristionchus mayeri]
MRNRSILRQLHATSSIQFTCSVNQSNLRRLHFHRVGNHYEHRLVVTANGGIFVGYVAVQGDVMYAGDLSKNTWYAGRAKYGGAVQFWLW